jgi:hypothetical protein
VPLAAPAALQQLGPLILSKHSLQLQEQGILRSIGDGAIEEDHGGPGPGEFLHQQHLVSVAAGETVGGMDVDNIDRRQIDQIAQALQGGADQTGAAVAIVNEQVIVADPMAVLCGARFQVTELAVDGVSLSLLIGRDPSVNGGSQRGCRWGESRILGCHGTSLSARVVKRGTLRRWPAEADARRRAQRHLGRGVPARNRPQG